MSFQDVTTQASFISGEASLMSPHILRGNDIMALFAHIDASLAHQSITATQYRKMNRIDRSFNFSIEVSRDLLPNQCCSIAGLSSVQGIIMLVREKVISRSSRQCLSCRLRPNLQKI
jgi:hypothetical protein